MFQVGGDWIKQVLPPNNRMEIDFNAARIPPAESSLPAAKTVPTPMASATVSFAASDALKNQLDALPTVRPEQVAKARDLVSASDYPPDYLLKRIANLLAVNLKPASPSDQPGQSG